MNNSRNCQTFFLGMILLILQCDGINTEEVCDNGPLKRLYQVGLSESKFWGSKSQDFEQCAKLCIRQSMCRSITYDTKSQMCEMNTGTISDTPKRTGATLVYSEFDWWPSSLDKNCYSRPCDVSETCIPGTLLGGSSECSYSCLTFSRDVCPLPPWGVTNGRTVGSVNTYKCEKGTIGGGKATCLASKQWDNEISPTCTDVYNHTCNHSSDLCSRIKGNCSKQGRCECGNNKSYNASAKECFLDCGDPTQVENADFQGNGNTRTYQCHTDYYPTATSNATLTCTENGWEPVDGFSCYSCGEPDKIAGATVNGAGVVRKYECDDDDDLYPIPGTGNRTITCYEDSKTWKPTDFKCGGLRLNPSHRGMLDVPNSGYLELFAKGEWRAVTHKDWDWRTTKVACKKLGLRFGGTFHKDWFDEENPNRLPAAYKLHKINCNGDEDSLEQCDNFNPSNGKIENEIALTCFDYNISAPDSVRLYPVDVHKGNVIVKIGSAPAGGVCSKGWSSEETEVVCKTIKSTWQHIEESHYDVDPAILQKPLKTSHIKCKGDEPHLFYCENEGWGNYTKCEQKFVQCGP